jgi:S1-C subfamily serine protease
MEAGIQEGDLIISLNTKEISDSETLVKVVTKLSPGDEVPLTIIRQRKTKHLEILVGSSHRFAA